MNWYMKCAGFLWALLEVAMSIRNLICFFVKTVFFEMELMKAKEIVVSAKS